MRTPKLTYRWPENGEQVTCRFHIQRNDRRRWAQSHHHRFELRTEMLDWAFASMNIADKNKNVVISMSRCCDADVFRLCSIMWPLPW